MKDTPEHISQMQFDAMMKLGINRRIELASEMYMAAREFIVRSLPPDLSPRQRNKKIVEKFYGLKLAEEAFGKE